MSEPRVAVVTGASRGLGREIARRLRLEGLTVVIVGRDAATIRAAANELVSAGGTAGSPAQAPRVVPIATDVTDAAAVARLAAVVTAELGRVDVLVNNAGVALDKWVSALVVAPEVVETTMRTNFIAPLALCQAFVPLMRRGGHGRIVNLSSQLGSLTRMTGMTLAYRASKVALNALTRVLAHELAAENILVNAVCPGWVRTGLGGADAPQAVEESVDTAVWLATLPDNGPRGGFFQDRQPLPW